MDSELQIDIEQIRPILEAIIEIFKKFVDFFVNYPNRRAIHLALYAKRKRSRDKNRNRIIRDFFNSQIQLRSVEQ